MAKGKSIVGDYNANVHAVVGDDIEIDVAENSNNLDEMDFEVSDSQVFQDISSDKTNNTEIVVKMSNDLLEENIVNMDDDVRSDPVYRPIDYDTKVKPQPKLCSRLSYNCEKNINHACCKTSTKKKVLTDNKKKDHGVNNHSKLKPKSVVKNDKMIEEQTESNISLFSVYKKEDEEYDIEVSKNTAKKVSKKSINLFAAMPSRLLTSISRENLALTANSDICRMITNCIKNKEHVCCRLEEQGTGNKDTGKNKVELQFGSNHHMKHVIA